METVEQLVSFNHIHVQLQGGAPWGFTLKGGLEHGEPLIITKIEDGGKASQTKKLRVGDELININGSALYGSRQEALILIKGSYRTLKITVRRRSVPCRRPHSWHVTKQAEPLSVTSTSDSPLDMQLYPAPFPTIWHSSNNNSDLSMPWRPLSRHHSNSGGSMESLETPPSQSYYDSQLSPVDPVIFHNKRDSAYSSFSASSNTSDYTVSLRPDDASSMDNILQGLGSGRPEGRPPSSASGPGDLQEEPGGLKSRLVFLRPEAKIRPSSYSYEDEHRGPPQPPARKDSFRATRARPGVLDKRCISAPVGIPSPSGYLLEEQQRRHTFSEKPVFENGTMETWRDSKGGSLEPYYIITSDSELYTHHRQNKEGKVNVQENHFENLQKGSPGPVLQQTESLTTGSVAEKPSDVHLKPESNHLFGSDQYSDAEHQLAPQGQQLEFCNNQSDSPSSGSSKWSQNLLQAPEEQGEPSSPDSLSSNKWNGSRSSTPGSSVLPKWEKPSMDTETLNSTQIPLSSHLVWGRSISVPGEQVNGFCSTAQSALSYSSTLEQQFKPISSAVSIGTLLEESQEQTGQGKREEDEGLKSYKKSSSSRQFRSSKSRRRDERFATNLRNEIQRIKAGLQKSKSPDGFLNCDETLKEEESGDLQAEREDTLKRGEILLQSSEIQPSVYRYSPQVTHSDREELPPSGQNSKSALTSSCHLHQPLVSPPRNKGSSGPDTACIVEHLPPKLDHGRKGEEGTNASKSRRWRFTPEHKLQPETDQAEKKWRKGELLSSSSGQSSWHQRSNPPTLTRSSSRTSVESDILPFADRRKFFEETSRNLSNSVSNLSKLNVHQPKLERQWCQSNPSSQDMAKPASQLPFRRFSYQGGLPQEGLFRPGVEGRRHFVNESVERNRGKDRMYESTEERELEKLREAAREKERELEELREREREMALERERKREKEIESELLQRKWEMERDLDSKMDSLQLTEKHNMYNREKWEMGSESSWHGQSFYSNSPPKPVIQDPRSRPQYSQSLQLSHCYQTNGHAESDNICSAFDPVGVPVHPKTQCSPREYILRSCTPTEAYPVSEREQTKLNRKFSLTERDYVQYRPDFRLVNGTVYQGLHSQRRNRIPVSSFVPSPLRSRAMSENNLCMEPWCSPKGAMSDAQDLKEEGRDFSSLRKPKALPPPRPPPPKWDQFYRRRASHHSLFPSSTPPQSSPLQFQPQGSPPSPLSAPEVTRQRAYSLPPREVPVSCPPRQERSLAPFSTNPSQSVFRPVAPAPKEKVTPFIAPEQHTRLCDAGTPLQEDQSQPAVLRPVSWKHKSFAEWDRSSTQEQCRTASAPGVPPDAAIKQEHSSYEKEPVPESYFTIDNLLPQQPQQQQQQQQYQQQRRGSGTLQVCYRQLESPQICTEPAGQEPDAPMETDIDDLTEEETMEDCTKPEVPVEMQCFACPITVLETDVDVPPPQKEDQKVEAFPVENLPVEHSGDSPERSSRLSSEGMQAHGSTYTSTSTANPQPLIQMKPCLIMNNSEQDEELNYKRQLMESLRKKLGVLQDAQRGLQEDIRANSQLGEEIEALVMTVCKPNEVDKFRMFIGDLEKVVSLRLSLSGRLLRVESALDCLDVETGHHERLPLLEKKQQLLLQLGEAQELKEHVDRREEAVGRVLSSCLTQEQLRDYKHFVKMKAALLVEQRQLDDKIRLGEEQLRGLRESLGPGSALHYGY